MTDNAVHDARVAGDGRQRRAGFVTATIAALFMSVIGALGTGEVSFGIRLVYWLLVMWTGAMIGSGVTAAIHAWGKLRHQPLLEVAAIALLIAFPLTLAVAGAGMLLLDMQRPSLAGMGIFFGLAVFISAMITGVTYGFAAQTVPGGPVVAGPQTPSLVAEPARLAERLPIGLRREAIIALEAEDHYLRVHLEDGRSALILLRLSDAIAELPAASGRQTHRSWWVANGTVKGFSKADGRATLTLRDDLQVPVSRSFYKPVNEAGWLS